MEQDKPVKIGITHGDVNGIGYELIIKTMLDSRLFDICTPIIYGSSKVTAYHRKALNIENFSVNNIKKPEEANIKRANIINCVDDNIRVELGKSTRQAGAASASALEAAVKDLKENRLDALVTAPINKENIQSEHFNFAGHTEYLQSVFNAEEVLMLMVGNLMKVGVVTGHIPLSRVPEQLNRELILNKLRILNQSLKEDFLIRKPKIAVLGLNPHAGENNMLGNEESEIIEPAIKTANEEDILSFGPYATDGFFGSVNYKNFDAVLAMYHDQGLTAFKILCGDTGVNYTAGLPVIRTSPAHGTAFELAGLGEARIDSFRSAIYTACDIFKNRKLTAEITQNPLPPVDISDI